MSAPDTEPAGAAPSTAEIVVQAPPHRAAEFGWAMGVVVKRWLGLPLRLVHRPGTDVTLQVWTDGMLRGEVVWTDVFLSSAHRSWRRPDTLPVLPLATWTLPDERLARRIGESSVPLAFGDGRFEQVPGRIRLPIDLSGSVFWFLSRYEEAVVGAPADRHGRFPGIASVAHRAGLMHRPLVDEWVEVLWWAIEQFAPGLPRRRRDARTWVSCDVDAPFSPAGEGLGRGLRQAASHLVNDRSPRLAALALAHAAASRAGVQRFDAFDTFDWMLDVNERAGQRATFFFLALDAPARQDAGYTLDQPRIAALLRRLLGRGHELGLHGSYRSIDDAARHADEWIRLRAAVQAAGGRSEDVTGSRQHYLRWKTGGTARQLSAMGVGYDSTLGFADAAGFRCGTCHAYPLFDLDGAAPLPLLERPLVLMEVTVISPVYLGLGCGEDAAARMFDLRARCRRFGGEFGLLWHNSNLALPAARDLYRRLIEG